MRFFLVSALLSPPRPSPPNPVRRPGWRAARFGMTPEEVLSAFPGEAVRISPEVKLADGNTIPVGIDGYRLRGADLRRPLRLHRGKLALVSLRTPAKKPVDAEAYAGFARRW